MMMVPVMVSVMVPVVLVLMTAACLHLFLPQPSLPPHHQSQRWGLW